MKNVQLAIWLLVLLVAAGLSYFVYENQQQHKRDAERRAAQVEVDNLQQERDAMVALVQSDEKVNARQVSLGLTSSHDEDAIKKQIEQVDEKLAKAKERTR